MKKLRIINALIWSAIGIVTIVYAIHCWDNCGLMQYVGATVVFGGGAFAVCIAIDQTIKDLNRDGYAD